MKEEWKVVKGFEDYQVSNLGRVKSLKCNKEKILKPGIEKSGYYLVGLFKNNKAHTKKVHKLVAISFLNHKPCGLKFVIDHINNDKLDNRLENLQIITNIQNLRKNKGMFSSKYKVVDYVISKKKWSSFIWIDNKRTNLGYFETELEANKAYQLKLETL